MLQHSKYLSLFTGIGGFEYGIQNAMPDAECIGYSEIDKYAIQTYEEHYEHKNYGDITAIEPAGLPDFDFLCGGFPCQAFSVAGKRRGFNEARGTLFFDVARILEHKRPRHLVLENVKGLLNHDGGQTIQTISRILTDLGYRIEWQVLNSKDHGVPQNRERIYIIGHLRGQCTGQIFPLTGQDGEPDTAGNHEQHGQERFIKTRHLSQNGSLISDSITLQASEQPHIVAGVINRGEFKETAGTALTVDSNYYKGADNHGQRPMVKQIGQIYSNTHNSQSGRIYDHVDGISPTLDVAAGGNRQPKILVGSPKYGNDGQRHMDYKISDEVPTIRATQHKSGDNQPRVIVREATAKGYAEATVGDSINISVPNSKTSRGRVGKGVANTLDTGVQQAVVDSSVRIRRLTPVECERLQGFPDNWTVGSDTQRYKQCGNAVTTNVVEAVMNELRRVCHV